MSDKCFEVDDDSGLCRSIFRLARRVRGDIKEASTGYTDYDVVDQTNAEQIVPNSLLLLVSMLLGENNDPHHFARILSVAQDILYVSSKGRRLTPKHVGLGVTVHYATRSKSLVQLLHTAGHCASYECVLKVDTSMTASEIDRYKTNGNKIIRRNLKPGKFAQFAGDNINILEETIDG